MHDEETWDTPSLRSDPMSPIGLHQSQPGVRLQFVRSSSRIPHRLQARPGLLCARCQPMPASKTLWSQWELRPKRGPGLPGTAVLSLLDCFTTKLFCHKQLSPSRRYGLCSLGIQPQQRGQAPPSLFAGPHMRGQRIHSSGPVQPWASPLCCPSQGRYLPPYTRTANWVSSQIEMPKWQPLDTRAWVLPYC